MIRLYVNSPWRKKYDFVPQICYLMYILVHLTYQYQKLKVKQEDIFTPQFTYRQKGHTAQYKYYDNLQNA